MSTFAVSKRTALPPLESKGSPMKIGGNPMVKCRRSGAPTTRNLSGLEAGHCGPPRSLTRWDVTSVWGSASFGSESCLMKASFECVVEASKRDLRFEDRFRMRRRFEVIWSSEQAHTVDALAVSGDEGRGSLRKASGSRQQTLIRGCPNGETHCASSIPI